MIATADGGYESASDYDEETLALITREEHGGDDSDHETQYMAPEDADRYECLVAQRVLSVQVTQAEQNQRHNLFHTKGVVKERSVRVIIDEGAATTWLAWRWWRSFLSPQGHIHILTTSNGSTTAARLR